MLKEKYMIENLYSTPILKNLIYCNEKVGL